MKPTKIINRKMKPTKIINRKGNACKCHESYIDPLEYGRLWEVEFVGKKFTIYSGQFEYREWRETYYGEEDLFDHVQGDSKPVLLGGEKYLPWIVSAALGRNGEEDCWLAWHTEAQCVAELLDLKHILETKGYPSLVRAVNNLVSPQLIAHGEDLYGAQWWLYSPKKYSQYWEVVIYNNPESPFLFSSEAQAREFLSLISTDWEEPSNEGRQPLLFY